jgi:hypothetical protein
LLTGASDDLLGSSMRDRLGWDVNIRLVAALVDNNKKGMLAWRIVDPRGNLGVRANYFEDAQCS